MPTAGKVGETFGISGNGYEHSSNFGGKMHEGNLTPRIASRFRSNVKSCILDGEMMSWNLKLAKFATKAANIDVKNLKDSLHHQPCFCVFDILYYNGEVLTNKPLNLRVEILKQAIDPLEGGIIFLRRKQISTKSEVVDSLNEAIDHREEGILMKEFISVYKPGVRKNGGWYKIKPEYTDGLTDTLDLLIIGGYFGVGRHQGIISHFLLGVADNVSGEKLFYSTAKIGSGYSVTELSELLEKLQPHWNSAESGQMPNGIEWTKEKPDVWIEPEKSIILEVKATEIISSSQFKTGCTLRFPRVKKIRYDKSWKDCMTAETLLEKRKAASGKLATSHFTYSGNQNASKKKRKHKISVLGSHDGEINYSHVVRISELLFGKEICVFSGFKDVQKFDVEKKIIEFGGVLVKNPGKNTFCVLAEDDSTVRIKNIIKCGSYDVMYTSWFFSILRAENDKIPELKPEYFLAMTGRTKKFFSKIYDEYGDHYTELSTKETIKQSMMSAKKEAEKLILNPDDKYNMDVELYSGPSPYGIFRGCSAYFDRFEIVSDPRSNNSSDLDIFRIDFQFRGGKCTEIINDTTTHVVVFSKNLSRLQEINYLNRERKSKFHVVTEKWIQTSILTTFQSNESGF